MKAIEITNLVTKQERNSRIIESVIVNGISYYGTFIKIGTKFYINFLSSHESNAKRQAKMSIKMEIENLLNKGF